MQIFILIYSSIKTHYQIFYSTVCLFILLFFMRTNLADNITVISAANIVWRVYRNDSMCLYCRSRDAITTNSASAFLMTMMMIMTTMMQQ